MESEDLEKAMTQLGNKSHLPARVIAVRWNDERQEYEPADEHFRALYERHHHPDPHLPITTLMGWLGSLEKEELSAIELECEAAELELQADAHNKDAP